MKRPERGGVIMPPAYEPVQVVVARGGRLTPEVVVARARITDWSGSAKQVSMFVESGPDIPQGSIVKAGDRYFRVESPFHGTGSETQPVEYIVTKISR